MNKDFFFLLFSKVKVVSLSSVQEVHNELMHKTEEKILALRTETIILSTAT